MNSKFLNFPVVFLVFLSAITVLSQSVQDDCPLHLILSCNKQENCGECIRAHHCCHWCYDQTNLTNTPRCNFIGELTKCGDKIERNQNSSVNIIENKDFTYIKEAEDATSTIQIRPQLFRITLRPDTPVNLTFTYKAAKNYPLELYYLGDLSYSMRNHLETLKNLGDDLGRSLANLTLNYKLAYGSFLDKPGMPFIYTNQKNLQNPCLTDVQKCEKTYLFKHRLNFTSKTAEFFDKVRNSAISANVDDLDGALEAIFQILVCNKKFGWSDYSRKIILLSTDSLLHTAGDGILAGASAVNYEELCLVDNEGNYTDPLKYDYPSLGQIKALLQKYKVNLIIAVTNDKIKSYKKMEKDILDRETFVGELQENSKNILDLVKTGFNDFIRQVEFFTNISHAPELDVKFFGDCYGTGHYNETSGCQNVEEEVRFKFKLQVALKDATTKKQFEQFFIREKNINEDIEIRIDYVSGNCQCSQYDQSNVLQCDHGTFSCDSCVCDKGWKGLTCSEECRDDPGACRHDENSRTCSGRGNCECSKCTCPEPFTGNYCQFECPTNRFGKMCNGQGTCFEGVCACNNGYTNDDCSCETSIDECKLTGSDSICNGHGACECNKCLCEEGYQGTYCEIKGGFNNFCDVYENYVLDYVENQTKLFRKDEVDVLIEELQDNDSCENECSIVYFSNANARRCFLNYCYHRGENNTVHLGTRKDCTVTAQAFGMFGVAVIILSILLGGLIIILLKKYHIYKMDQAEYKKFVEDQRKWNELNPIYKSPVTEFRNPMAR